MTPVICWLIYPLLFGLVSLGWGLLVAGIAKVRLGMRDWRTFPLTVTLVVDKHHYPRRIMFSFRVTSR